MPVCCVNGVIYLSVYLTLINKLICSDFLDPGFNIRTALLYRSLVLVDVQGLPLVARRPNTCIIGNPNCNPAMNPPPSPLPPTIELQQSITLTISAGKGREWDGSKKDSNNTARTVPQCACEDLCELAPNACSLLFSACV